MSEVPPTAGDHPRAEVLVLERIAEDALADIDSLRTMLAGRVVSTGDRVGGFEIVEIVPPDEPAVVDERIALEFV
jgi:hypothetical protein